ncbi:MAG: ergothioneine biosynthesis protein EgtB [Flavobacteriales bacterium]
MSLKDKFITTRKRTEEICGSLLVEDYVPQAADFSSPPKWHLAHITWFFEEMILKKNLEGYEEFSSEFGFLFNSYYQGIGERIVKANRGLITRPTVKDVYGYRAYVDKHMVLLLEKEADDDLQQIIILGINHEQQHQELLITDIKYLLGQNPVFPVYREEASLIKGVNQKTGWLDIPEGVYEIGHKGEGFSFDNELGRHKVFLHDFEICQALVTNRDFMEFIESGGYQKFQFWLDEGWSWVEKNEINSPEYWRKINGKWHVYTLGGLVEVDPSAILAHVSFYEANAYATWKGMRLPTEFEWEVAADSLDWGERWEWTSSSYSPYPNFKIAAGALGEYNGKFMVNQMVLRGGSVATSEGHSRKTYRNFFHPHFQWQYSGIRLCR